MLLFTTRDSLFIESEVIDYLNNCNVSTDDYDIDAIVADCVDYLSQTPIPNKRASKMYIDYIPEDVFTEILQRHDISE